MQTDLRSLVDLIQTQRLESKQQMAGLQSRIAALERKYDSKWASVEEILKRRAKIEFEGANLDGDSATPALLPREERSSMKRSFLSRFLENEEDDHAPKDTAERIKEARFHFLERIFGICDADPKKGREASNVIHPQSPFATGPQPPKCWH